MFGLMGARAFGGTDPGSEIRAQPHDAPYTSRGVEILTVLGQDTLLKNYFTCPNRPWNHSRWDPLKPCHCPRLGISWLALLDR
jgi:hypothetical protein